MARMRTIKGAINFLRQADPDTCVSEWFIRMLLKSGKLKHHKAGNRYLIDIDYLTEFLRNPPMEQSDQFDVCEDCGNTNYEDYMNIKYYSRYRRALCDACVDARDGWRWPNKKDFPQSR